MANDNNESIEATHIGWVSSPSTGKEGMDRLVLEKGSEQNTIKKSNSTFSCPDQSEPKQLNARDLKEKAFVEVNDTPMESPTEIISTTNKIFDTTKNEDQADSKERIVSNKKSSTNHGETTFS